MDAELERAAEALVVSCRLPAQPDQQRQQDLPTPELVEFGRAMRAASKADRLGALRSLAEALPTCAPFGAARLAIYCGAAVEGGADPSETGPAVLGQLRQQVNEAAALVALAGDSESSTNLADLPAATPEQIEAVHALQFVAQSAVSHLARSEPLRRELGNDDTFMR